MLIISLFNTVKSYKFFEQYPSLMGLDRSFNFLLEELVYLLIHAD